jgi:hypothetical protein
VRKARLALAVAGELVDRYPDGAWLAELAPLADPALVPHAVATALGLREEPGRPLLETLVDLSNLAGVAERRGDYDRAAALSEESLRLNRTIGAEEQAVEGLQTFVLVTAARGQPRRAAQLAGAAEALREILDVPLRPHQQAAHDQAVQALRASLGEAEFAAAWAEGRELSLEQAIALSAVLAIIRAVGGPPPAAVEGGEEHGTRGVGRIPLRAILWHIDPAPVPGHRQPADAHHRAVGIPLQVF